MHLKSHFCFVLIVTSLPAFAAKIVDRHWTNEDEVIRIGLAHHSIPLNKNDPYAPVAWMLRGEYKGQPIDVTHERPVLRLASGNRNFVRYANVEFQGEYWIADIPATGGVQDVFMQQHDFGSPQPIAHSDALFQFYPGSEVRLTSQDRSKTLRHVKVPALETSADATGPTGVGFAFLKDLRPRTVLNIRVTGIPVRAPVVSFLEVQKPSDPRNPGFRYHLPIPDQEWRDKFFFDVARESEAHGLNTVYNLLKASCTTMILKLMDESLGAMPGYRKPWILDRIFNSLPRNLRTSLTLRNMYEGRNGPHKDTPERELRPVRPD